MRTRSYGQLAFLLLFQLSILALVPAKKLMARLVGTDVTLATRPVDPYDPLAGYYVTLGYEIEVAAPVTTAESTARAELKNNRPVWLEVAPAAPAWTLVKIHTERPKARGKVFIRGTWRRSRARLEEASRLYIPEDQRDDVADALAKTKGRGLVDLKVGGDGTAVVLRLRVGGQTYGD